MGLDCNWLTPLLQPNIIDQIGETIKKLRAGGLNQQREEEETRRQIGEAVQRLRRSGSIRILLVEQYVDFCLEVGDSFYLLDRGNVVARGPIALLNDDILLAGPDWPRRAGPGRLCPRRLGHPARGIPRRPHRIGQPRPRRDPASPGRRAGGAGRTGAATTPGPAQRGPRGWALGPKVVKQTREPTEGRGMNRP